jgi:hypothetical protein
MSQERWDVVLRYLDGPLAMQPEHVYRGPVVRLGANPGPGGVALQGYRGLNGRHAVITAYDGGSVAIDAVGSAQVRVAPHANVDWADVDVLVGAVYLNDGDTIHLGAPGRGITFGFVRAQRLGVWEERRILSDAAQATPEVQPTNIQELSTQGGVPTWFIGGIVLVGLLTAVAVLVSIVRVYTRDIAGLGPVDEGREYYDMVPMTTEVNSDLRDGLQQPFKDFIMAYNAEMAGRPEIRNRPAKWDQKLLDQVTRTYQLAASGWRFWKRLEEVESDYAEVVRALQKSGMPEVFAAVPYQESRYRAEISSPVCAQGYWQFMPEVAHRYGLVVRDCAFRGSNVLWSPTELAPPNNVRKRAQYVAYDEAKDESSCRIKSCAVDERSDLVLSTEAAIKSLREAYEDPDLAESGAVVQLAIASHNCGYDDSRFQNGRTKRSNILPAYRKYLSDKSLNQGPYFLGDTLTCTESNFKNDFCGGYIPGESQHYTPGVIAIHFLAVCYYGANYGNEVAFRDWKRYVRGDGYCTQTAVPDRETVRGKLGL